MRARLFNKEAYDELWDTVWLYPLWLLFGDMPWTLEPGLAPGAAAPAKDEMDVEGVCRLLVGLLNVPEEASEGRMMGEGRDFGRFLDAPLTDDGRADCPFVNVRGEATMFRSWCDCD